MLKRILFMLPIGIFFIAIIACESKDAATLADPVSAEVPEQAVFSAIARAWFDQAAENEPSSPNGLVFVFDGTEIETAFDDVLATQQHGQLEVN